MHNWARAIILGTSGERIPPEAITAAQAGAEALRAYLDRFREEHKGDTNRSLIYILTEAEAEGDVLSADELLAFVTFLYTAGTTPVGSSLANGVSLLLEHPDQLARLREDPALMPDAVSEMLRFDGPTHVHFRRVSEPAELGGRHLRLGDSVLAMGGAATRDPEERFLRRLVEITERKPARITTDLHPAYRRAIRWIIGRKAWHRTTQYLNNYTEQSHRAVKQRYYPMQGFGSFESASRFCSAFDELRQYFRVRRRGGAHVALTEQRRLFLTRWHSLISELAAA